MSDAELDSAMDAAGLTKQDVLAWVRSKDADPPPAEPQKEVAALIERLHTEADQCRNDGANDIAILLDDAITALARLAAPVPDKEKE